MSIPRDHHYLPQFYLSRWAVDGRILRYIRPRGLAGPIHHRWVSPSAVGYQTDLYANLEIDDPFARQKIEIEFLQRIDSIAAKALTKLEKGEAATPAERANFLQFLLSLMHRTPERIDWLQKELKRRLKSDLVEFEDVSDEWFRGGALDVFTDLVSSDWSLDRLAKLQVFRIDVGEGKFSLLTSDNPILLSNGLLGDTGFMMLPTGPKTIVIMIRNKRVVEAFSSQETNSLVKGINDAVVRQAKSLVIACQEKQTQFIENRLGRSRNKGSDSVANDGLMRWQVP